MICSLNFNAFAHERRQPIGRDPLFVPRTSNRYGVVHIKRKDHPHDDARHSQPKPQDQHPGNAFHPEKTQHRSNYQEEEDTEDDDEDNKREEAAFPAGLFLFGPDDAGRMVVHCSIV
jgi:hypothetical protein